MTIRSSNDLASKIPMNTDSFQRNRTLTTESSTHFDVMNLPRTKLFPGEFYDVHPTTTATIRFLDLFERSKRISFMHLDPPSTTSGYPYYYLHTLLMTRRFLLLGGAFPFGCCAAEDTKSIRGGGLLLRQKVCCFGGSIWGDSKSLQGLSLWRGRVLLLHSWIVRR